MRPPKAWILLALCSTTIVVGCSYKTLRIFIDGVPDPGKKKPATHQQPQALAQTKSTFSQHPPFAEKQCDSCHDRAMTNNLVAPKEELCFICHDFPTDKKYVHGPLASGGCLVCHDPHSSKFPKLLVAESGTFCLYCHDRAAIPKDESHVRTDIQCITCHDAHMSDKKYLLK